MLYVWQRPRRGYALALAGGAVSIVFGGCAGPGSPRPPSLHIPEAVRDLAATRSGDQVQVRFSVPSRTTDGLALGSAPLYGSLCRQAAHAAPCVPVDVQETSVALSSASPGDKAVTAVWTDTLPSSLSAGPPRLLLYRVELRNAAHRSAGPSDAAYVPAGAAPAAIHDLHAEGSRLGVFLHWTPATGSGDVLLERRQIDPPPAFAAPPSHPDHGEKGPAPFSEARRSHANTSAAPGTVWLAAAPPSPDGDAVPGAGEQGQTGQTLDTTVTEGVRYRYVALRRERVTLGGRTLELRSADSPPVEFAWRDIYPPPPPQQLTALGYHAAAGSAAPPGTVGPYAVDLIWQPVNDPRVSGYLVDRQAISPSGAAEGAPERLTAVPVTSPSFHDLTAKPGLSFRYQVRAVDPRGNQSAPATAVVSPLAP